MSSTDKARSFYQRELKSTNEEIYELTLKKRAYEVALEQLAGSENKQQNDNQYSKSHTIKNTNNNDNQDKYKCDDCGRLNVTEAVRDYCLKKNKYNGKLYCFECQQKH